MCSQKTLKALIVLTIVLFTHVQAQREGFKLQDWQHNKFWWYSSDAPITKALDKFPDVVRDAKKTLDHLDRLEARILSVLRSRKPLKGDTLFQPCRSTDLRWRRAVAANFGVRGFVDPDVSCVTDIPGVQFSRNEPAPYTVEELYDVVFSYGVNVQRRARSVVAPIIDVVNNFTKPSYVFNFEYNTPKGNCVLHPLNAVRIGEKWRTTAIIQNRPLNEFMPLDGRKILVEFFRVVDGHLTDNALLRLPVRPATGTERKVREDATTILISSRANATPATYRNIPIEENPAIVEALSKADVSFDQAQDATTPSNIAILVLPLFLNLLPVTMFSNVSGIKMLLYIVLGDVVTVIPLFIKGVELILIRKRHNISVVTRMSSSVGGNMSEAAAAEIFAADCQAHDVVLTIGVIYVTLSVAFLIFGIILEIAAKRYKAYRRKRHLMRMIWSRVDVPAGDTDEDSPMVPSSWDSEAFAEALQEFGIQRGYSEATYSEEPRDDDSRKSTIYPSTNPLKKLGKCFSDE